MECNCLLLLIDEILHKAVACDIVWFEQKTKYNEECIPLEWYKYSNAVVRAGNTRAQRKGRTNSYHLPYDRNFIDDALVLVTLQNHWLCTSRMQLVMSMI
jgi:hypothetical protein